MSEFVNLSSASNASYVEDAPAVEGAPGFLTTASGRIDESNKRIYAMVQCLTDIADEVFGGAEELTDPSNSKGRDPSSKMERLFDSIDSTDSALNQLNDQIERFHRTL